MKIFSVPYTNADFVMCTSFLQTMVTVYVSLLSQCKKCNFYLIRHRNANAQELASYIILKGKNKNYTSVYRIYYYILHYDDTCSHKYIP